MSVVHMWLPGDGQTAFWCGHDMLRADCAVTCHLVDAVTCTTCLGMASDFGAACRARLRELVKVTEPAWSVSLLGRLDHVAKATATCHAPEVNARRIAQLAIAVADLVKHIAEKGQP